mmetsp:Transcript_24877/g.25231  ORF Transcript_24877/g.25231 Transcript_24877/m.25231 type:complete len:198 (-) Transcript_24877:151-744(-)
MSLSVSLDEGKTLEWTSLGGLNGLFAKRSQLLSGKFYTMLREMLRFHHEAPQLLLLHPGDPRKHIPTRDYLRQQGYSTAFATYYLLPMMAALWSASMTNVLQFPISQLVGFLCNHHMLQVFARPQVRTSSVVPLSYCIDIYIICHIVRSLPYLLFVHRTPTTRAQHSLSFPFLLQCCQHHIHSIDIRARTFSPLLVA